MHRQPLRHYVLRCAACEAQIDDDGIVLECGAGHAPALLVGEYAAARLQPDACQPGIFRYATWLPIQRVPAVAARGAVYHSEVLGAALGLSNLWVAFSGFWPQRGASLPTGTFKDLEAMTVLARLPHDFPTRHRLVLASAGNTAAAFARACSDAGVPCVIVVPEGGLDGITYAGSLAACVTLVSLSGGADYTDAIEFAGRAAGLAGWVAEGGAKNVARRDGIGTVLLDAVETMRQLPDVYVQAVGSGTGGIAVHQAARRLVADGRWGDRPPRLVLCQNAPFAPMHAAWRAGQQQLPAMPDARRQIAQLVSPVLSNQKPPYAIKGGVWDALAESGGQMFVATNEQARRAMALFESCEGVAIDPAAGVALAGLAQAVEDGSIPRDAHVLLHATGGGRTALSPTPVAPDLDVALEDLSPERVGRALEALRVCTDRRGSRAGPP